MQYHQFFLDNVTPSDSVLDVGSGNGKVAFEVAGKAKEVVGIDIRIANVNKARAKYDRPNLRYILGDATKHNFTDQFDIVILSNVLEHIEYRVSFLRALSHLAPKVLIRVPSLHRDWVTVFKKNEGLEYRLDDTHFIEYTESSLRKEIAAAGLEVDSLSHTFGEFYVVVRR